MNTTEIFRQFELQVDDTTELSSDEELIILNRVYRRILGERAWEFLKKEFTGTTSTTLPYVSLPSDFKALSYNANFTDSSEYSYRPVVFVGPEYSKYQVVSWSDRRQYRDQDGYCYVDIVNNRLYFTKQPTEEKSIEFDYVYNPATLVAGDTPIIPARYHDAFVYGMAIDDAIIQQSDKAKSYAPENASKYKAVIDDMALWNSQLVQI